MGRRKKVKQQTLTEAELKVMAVIWQRQEATVQEVIEHLSAQLNYAYTTVSTIMRQLEKKKVLASYKVGGKKHVYYPLVAKADYEKVGLHHVVTHLFGGVAMSLVKRLIGDGDLSQSELVELQKLLEEKKGL